MELFENINVKTLSVNLFHQLDNEWMLITAGTQENFNTMTASWGSFGILWNKPIAITFIRPQRYTLNFVEANEYFTLSFFDNSYKSILNFCGQYSGKEVNKIAKTGLKPYFFNKNIITYEQAMLVFECRKIYVDDLKHKTLLIKILSQKFILQRIFIKYL